MNNEKMEELAIKIVDKMIKLKSLEEWFSGESSSFLQVYENLELDEEAAAFGELAKLMTLMDICEQDEAYEKCAIIKNKIDKTKTIIKKYKKE